MFYCQLSQADDKNNTHTHTHNVHLQLAETLSEDVNRMWDSISKPPQYVGSRIEDFFEVQYAALPHYEEKYDDFVADAIVLRRR